MSSLLTEESGADHGFSVRKKDGRSEEEVHAEVADALVAWVARVLPA